MARAMLIEIYANVGRELSVEAVISMPAGIFKPYSTSIYVFLDEPLLTF